jgi:hypothetical protein
MSGPKTSVYSHYPELSALQSSAPTVPAKMGLTQPRLWQPLEPRRVVWRGPANAAVLPGGPLDTLSVFTADPTRATRTDLLGKH